MVSIEQTTIPETECSIKRHLAEVFGEEIDVSHAKWAWSFDSIPLLFIWCKARSKVVVESSPGPYLRATCLSLTCVACLQSTHKHLTRRFRHIFVRHRTFQIEMLKELFSYDFIWLLLQRQVTTLVIFSGNSYNSLKIRLKHTLSFSFFLCFRKRKQMFLKGFHISSCLSKPLERSCPSREKKTTWPFLLLSSFFSLCSKMATASI